MKLLIEINDYEKLKNIAETVMNDKHSKTKNILFCVTSLLLLASLVLMINAICYKKSIFIIVFSILTSVFLYCFLNILTNGAHLVNIYNKIQEMQKSSDEQSCLQIESWLNTAILLNFSILTKMVSCRNLLFRMKKDIYTNMIITRLRESLMRTKMTIFFTCMNRTERENHYDTSISINCCYCSPASAYSVCSIQTQTKQHQRTGSNY